MRECTASDQATNRRLAALHRIALARTVEYDTIDV